MKNICFITLFLISVTSFAQEAPMLGWTFDAFYVTLNGRLFWDDQYAESWREQDGYALVNGKRIHYWLYDTSAYHNGNSEVIYNRIIPHWVEKMGYVIDFDNIRKINPNPDLASSVKTLMTQRGCDLSLSLVTDSNPHYVVINEYSKNKGIYWTTIYYLYR